jgi:hypothetical protein
MIANSAFLAAMVTMLLAFATLDELTYLAPYRRLIFGTYLPVIVTGTFVIFFNLFACFYAISRWMFLKDTGRKLAHIEKQLRTPDTIVRDLSERLADED